MQVAYMKSCTESHMEIHSDCLVVRLFVRKLACIDWLSLKDYTEILRESDSFQVQDYKFLWLSFAYDVSDRQTFRNVNNSYYNATVESWVWCATGTLGAFLKMFCVHSFDSSVSRIFGIFSEQMDHCYYLK